MIIFISILSILLSIICKIYAIAKQAEVEKEKQKITQLNELCEAIEQCSETNVLLAYKISEVIEYAKRMRN